MEYLCNLLISGYYTIYNRIFQFIVNITNGKILNTQNKTCIRIKTTNNFNNLNPRFYFERYFDSCDIDFITVEKHFNTSNSIIKISEIQQIIQVGCSYYIKFKSVISPRTKNFIEKLNYENKIVYTDLFSNQVIINTQYDNNNRLKSII